MTQQAKFDLFKFGVVPGIDVGFRAETMYELKQKGIHRSSNSKHRITRGVLSIILGPKDIDNGDSITVIFEVNVKSKHEFLADAFKKNYNHKLPVRVIRSARHGNQYTPLMGYRYDGLYRVVLCGHEKTKDQTKWHIEMKKLSGQPVFWEHAPVRSCLFTDVPEPTVVIRGQEEDVEIIVPNQEKKKSHQ